MKHGGDGDGGKNWLPTKRSFLIFAIGWSVLLTILFEVIQRHTPKREESNIPGKWDPVSANIDWCERNYIWTYYIAEFHNTMTSFLFCVASVICVYYHWYLADEMFIFGFVLLAIVGVGSAAFHGMLTYDAELWDEIPMMWVSMVMCYNIYFHDKPTTRFSKKLIPYMIGWLSFVTLLIVTAARIERRGRLEIFARALGSLSFTPPFLYTLIRVFDIAKANVENDDIYNQFKVGMTGIYLAQAFWVTDISACATLQKLPLEPHLHAYGWHMLMAYSVYVLNVLCLYNKLYNIQGRDVRVHWLLNIIPIIITMNNKV